MKNLTFAQLKNMSHHDLKEAKFLIQQDMDPKYCSEHNRIVELKKLLNYVKYLMYYNINQLKIKNLNSVPA